MSPLFRRRPELPREVLADLALPPRDRVLAWGQDAATGAYVVASMFALHHVPGRRADGAAPTILASRGSSRWTRPWLDVAAGAWEPTARTLTATWADGGTPSMWTFADEQVRLPAVFHDRVNASVYIVSPVRVGERDLGRVALRKDLATGALVEQVSLGRTGTSAALAKDPEVAAYVQVLLRDLKEQAGLV